MKYKNCERSQKELFKLRQNVSMLFSYSLFLSGKEVSSPSKKTMQ